MLSRIAGIDLETTAMPVGIGQRLTDDGQAKQLGIREGDEVYSYNNVEITSLTELRTVRDGIAKEQAVDIVVMRDGRPLTFEIHGGKIGIYTD